MKDVYILGSGGFAKEVHFLLRQIGGYQIKAFVEKDASSPIQIGDFLTPVISEDELASFKNTNLVIGIGDPGIVTMLSEKFKDNFRFPNIIHPNVVADWPAIKIGEGNVICAGVSITTHIELGSYNIINLNCTIGHDTVIGSGNVISPGCNISGRVIIEDGVYIGTNATILPHSKIGSRATIGAVSLVNKSVEGNTTVVGVPAKVLYKS
ncbi:MAG: acetyltransferase [Bacteroidetes bacterium]|nr:acetyltransferase [Bacteroidota bacterium]